MNDIMCQVYIISDLHLGGEYPEGDNRGFQMCTKAGELANFVRLLTQKPRVELIINGDVVDFLAEKTWSAFTSDPSVAVEKLQAIAGREKEKEFFKALQELLNKGHRLTILLGNHDVELALPDVRREFEKILGIKDGHNYRFIYNGEAYIIGDALIEHGNRYDKWNIVNYGKLRGVCSLQSRRQTVNEKHAFPPPAGSFMVEKIMNPIKEIYRFVDLLKPEMEAVVPILLALEPGYLSKTLNVIKLMKEANRHELEEDAKPRFGDEIAAKAGRGGRAERAIGGEMGGPVKKKEYDPAHEEALKEIMPTKDIPELLKLISPEKNMGGEISTSKDKSFWAKTAGILDLIKAKAEEAKNAVVDAAVDAKDAIVNTASIAKEKTIEYILDQRLTLLLKALKGLEQDKTFDRSSETDTVYLNAAKDLAEKGGFKYIIFGHTHLAKKIPINDGKSCYLNSGTWCNLMQFPASMLSNSEEAKNELEKFLKNLKSNDIEPMIKFIPTYIRLDIGENEQIIKVELKEYDGKVD